MIVLICLSGIIILGLWAKSAYLERRLNHAERVVAVYRGSPWWRCFVTERDKVADAFERMKRDDGNEGIKEFAKLKDKVECGGI